MAIFGSLQQMPISDLLPLLSAKDGALELFNLGRHPQVTLYFSGGMLHCLYVGGREAEPLKARTEMTFLMGLRRGSFEFIPGARAHRCQRPLSWSVDQLMLSTVTIQDEIAGLEQQLPHADTVFVARSAATPADGRLQDFWNRAHARLREGASARALAQELGLPLEHVQYYLWKLRQTGQVASARPRQARPTRSHGGVASRLLGALKKRFFGSPQAWNH